MRTNPDDEAWYPLVASFDALCDTYELIATEQAVADGSTGMRQLARKIEVDMPLCQSDIDAARAAISWMKTVTAPMTPEEFSGYSVAVQVRATMASIGRQRRTA